MIPAVIERCAGIDIGKREVTVTVMVGPADQEPQVETRSFGTTTMALKQLELWLLANECTSAAMESTGSYWIPVWNVLQGSLALVLGNARHIRSLQRDKTDREDSEWLAHLHRHGMISGSFVPPKDVVRLRDLTRRRKKLIGNLSSEKNRVQRILETANVKLGNVVSDVFGISGQEILQALLKAEELTANEMAEMARGRLRRKRRDLAETLQDHSLEDHHRWLIRQSVEHCQFLTNQIGALDTRIQPELEAHQREWDLLQTIPGIDRDSAAAILAEIGFEMEQFGHSTRLVGWAGICPANRRSAGKQKSTRSRKGNRFLRGTLVQACWAAVRQRSSFFQKRFYRLSRRMDQRKALVACAHSLLTVIYFVLERGEPYQAPDPATLHERERGKLVQHHVKQLRKLGAPESVIEPLVAQMTTPAPIPPTSSAGGSHSANSPPPPKRKPRPRATGALGFRAY